MLKNGKHFDKMEKISCGPHIQAIANETEVLYLQQFESMDQFKQELIEYLDYYNNRRIKARLKGLPPALHRQQALLAA